MWTIWPTRFCTSYSSYDAEPIVNIGRGEDVTIRELAEITLSVIGYSGRMITEHFVDGRL